MGENKQVRVDNWGIFFLQRLQLFFSKTDYCDLTLQFQGNVQLKVHRLVLNACTEYFELLEHSDRLIDDSVILMPEMLQADVVVPIINFMYTGTLEYTLGIYHKLYQAADLMRMSVLTKLLDAQRQPTGMNKTDNKQKIKTTKSSTNLSNSLNSPIKRVAAKNILPELPPTLPGRKLPIWKRKTIPHSSSHSDHKMRTDPLALDQGKPTRFEWPEDDLDLPPLDMMDISDFGDISYTSKPLLREDDVKPIIMNQSEVINKSQIVKEEIPETSIDERTVQQNTNRTAEKRKVSLDTLIDKSPKKIKIVENEHDTTISVISSGNSVNFDPTKIVSEILKKYPHLVKKKKNIKLKILSKPKEKETSEPDASREKVPAKKVATQIRMPVTKPEPLPPPKETIWCCKECTENSGKPTEFILYYLYRKHMTDIHSVRFDDRICKYCGIAFARTELHSFHLFTKHGIKPSGHHVFPSCSQCPYVALSKQALRVHKSKHKSTEMQCSECKLGFISSEAISSHVQITGHMGKSKRNIYDCQYCMKTSQSAISLLSHIKSNHESEGRRDGIVSMDDIDLEETVEIEEEDQVQEGEADGEYIVPEIISPQPNKVKIISDVKVPPAKIPNRTEVVTLEQNKAHGSVPSSIATSLGLLDIVVLDENQQFILQNQEDQTGDNRTEYILPQIGQRNIRGDGLGSTADELVMVLTDQDYKDGHSAIATDNSNIVVLYSHPADGQQGQFITSQGNLMVNSETGLLEIRNGATIATTSASEIVVSDSHNSHIETIEMIQREIDGGHVMKQEPFYEEEHKPQVSTVVESTQYVDDSTIEQGDQQGKEAEVEENTECQVEKVGETESEVTESEVTESEVTESEVTESEVTATEESAVAEAACEDGIVEGIAVEASSSISERNSSVDETDPAETTIEEDIDKSTEVNTSIETVCDLKDTATIEPMELEINNSSTENQSSEVIISVEDRQESSDNVGTEETEELCQEEQAGDLVETEETPMEIESEHATDAEVPEDGNTEANSVEDQSTELYQEASSAAEVLPLPDFEDKDAEKPYSPTDPVDMQVEIESNIDPNEKQDGDSVNEHENSVEVSQCEAETDKDTAEVPPSEVQQDSHREHDENSQSSQESHRVSNIDDNKETASDQSTKISILDDWEDTDSQHSDNRTKSAKKGAEETVHKLMDDWEEDEVEK